MIEEKQHFRLPGNITEQPSLSKVSGVTTYPESEEDNIPKPVAQPSAATVPAIVCTWVLARL